MVKCITSCTKLPVTKSDNYFSNHVNIATLALPVLPALGTFKLYVDKITNWITIISQYDVKSSIYTINNNFVLYCVAN